MRSGEYFTNRKSIIKGEISEGLLELIITVVFFGIGFGVLSLFDLTDCDSSGDLAILIGAAVIILPIVVIFGIKSLFEKRKKGKTKKDE